MKDLILLMIITFFSSLNASAACFDQLHDKVNEASLARLKKSSSYQVDDSTHKDLAFDETLIKSMEDKLTNPFSRQGLRHQLQNPSLNPASIIQRQDAIKYLADNPKLMEDLDEMIKKSSKYMGQLYTLELGEELTFDTWKKHTALNDFFKLMFTVPAAYDPSFISLLPMAIMFGSPRASTSSAFNKALVNTKEVLKHGKQIATLTGNEKLPDELISLFNVLSRKDPEMKKGLRYFGWAGISRLKMNLDWILPIGSFGSFGVKELKRSVKQAAKYIEAMGDLEIMLRFAQQYQKKPDKFIFPTMNLDAAAPSKLVIKDGNFPSFVMDDIDSVPNSVSFNSQESQMLLMTGPNSGGKSTALRTVAHLTILAQMGMPVPAKYMELTPLRLITNMQTEDSIAEGVSLFRSEIRRGADILEAINSENRYLLLLDEIFKGTDHEQHQAAELTMVRHILKSDQLAFFSTHDRKLKSYLGDAPGIRYVHVDDDGSFVVKEGQSSKRNAADIMQQEGLPEEYIRDFIRTYDETAPDAATRSELIRPDLGGE